VPTSMWVRCSKKKKPGGVTRPGFEQLEGQGQVLGYYTNELRHRGYEKGAVHVAA
jgi:hypothetical protein